MFFDEDVGDVKMKYKILRPHTHLKTFAMPNKEDLEKLVIGSVVKVVFAQKERISERMWCKIVDSSNAGYIKAKLQNTPFNLDMKYGQLVKFHVTDIIAIKETE